MNVRQLLTTASPHRVAEIYTEAYRDDGWNTPEAYGDFLDRIKAMVPVSTGDWRVVLADKDGRVDVLGAEAGSDEHYSMSLTPWEEWIAMDIEPGDKHPDEVAAHIYYEMTWHGWPEKQEAFRADLEDSIERINRLMDEGADLSEHGFDEWKPDE